MNFEEVRDEPVNYGVKPQKRKRQAPNDENNPPNSKLAKNLFGGPVFTAKDPFTEKPSALFQTLQEETEDGVASDRKVFGERHLQ